MIWHERLKMSHFVRSARRRLHRAVAGLCLAALAFVAGSGWKSGGVSTKAAVLAKGLLRGLWLGKVIGTATLLIVMGLIVHAGQLSLLLRSGWLRAGEVARMEAFVAVVILLTIVASAGSLPPLVGSMAMVGR